MHALEVGKLLSELGRRHHNRRRTVELVEPMAVCATTTLPLVALSELAEVELGGEHLFTEELDVLVEVVSSDVRVVRQVRTCNRHLAIVHNHLPLVKVWHVLL